jgi:NDP-4-keto-2,6-dideoxyhexose 3-C-methyltransferase
VNCRSCGSSAPVPVLELGNHRLADFRTDDVVPPSFPLNLLFCPACGLAQLDTTVDRELMYHERYGFKSGVNEQIRADHQAIVDGVLKRCTPRSWLDIACNDGTLLSMVPERCYRAGIDPVAKYCREADPHADYIANAFFHPRYLPGVKYDVVTSISVFYDIDDPNEFVDNVAKVLAPGGVWVIQQNYLADTLRLNAVDNICHEHLTYYSLWSLNKLLHRHGLEVFDVEFSTVNGGCIRTYVARKGVRRVEDRVAVQGQHELLNLGLDSVKPFDVFAQRVGDRLAALQTLVDSANDRGERVAIYGASTRGGTIWQACRFGPGDFVYAVDRNPEKVDKTMSSLGIPIVSEDTARDDMPDWMVASIWFFRDQIVKREADYLNNGGRLVFPLPDLEVVG